MLNDVLPSEVFIILLVFVRIGAAMMLLPGFSEPYVSPRARLVLALLISLVVAPVVRPGLPPLPDGPLELFLLVAGELLIGFFLGTIARLFVAAMATAGMIIAFMSSMANALTDDPSSTQQGAITGSFLTTLAIVLIFMMDLHHLMLSAVIDSYSLFVPGQPLPMNDFSEMVTRVLSASFLLAFQLSAPFVAVGTIFYLGLGILGRLMPQVQIFFVAMPMQVALGFVILLLSLPVMMGLFVTRFQEAVTPFLSVP